MSILDNLPHKCSIGRQKRVADNFGGNTYEITVEQSEIECWEQPASDSEIKEFDKRGQSVTTKVYFVENPLITERHRILITERNGVACANLDITDVDNPDTLDVKSVSNPDASVGLGILWRVMCGNNSGNTQ